MVFLSYNKNAKSCHVINSVLYKVGYKHDYHTYVYAYIVERRELKPIFYSQELSLISC